MPGRVEPGDRASRLRGKSERHQRRGMDLTLLRDQEFVRWRKERKAFQVEGWACPKAQTSSENVEKPGCSRHGQDTGEVGGEDRGPRRPHPDTWTSSSPL